MTVTIEVTAWSDPDGVKLRAAQRTELDTRYGADTEPGVKPTAEDIAVFLIARDDAGEALGCGALRLLDDDTAEIKRMFVVAAARGTGAATLLLRALESEAVTRGITRLLLETGPAQPDAVRFYQREGYAPAPPFGHYVHSATSLFFGRDL
ncbi:GNAT family N-acetyltransferase [Subtercola sp. PAMC28395]|uniref:GNAT family N-acetyltransferase n=1 Tax=Subtercola sp. PAMC28395 TaxID=2846775 RepID=UPI001C0B2D81|nr:GNAT family N-acetyltransferase [Subtercola sp. PAMC28395]QWT24616.1 GNAT family N-acetyltransferase [Subtercola sp. PAMC28395]